MKTLLWAALFLVIRAGATLPGILSPGGISDCIIFILPCSPATRQLASVLRPNSEAGCHGPVMQWGYIADTGQNHTDKEKNMFDKNQNTHSNAIRTLSKGQLLEEISWFEARLNEIGGNGDCAYEKALARSYEQAVSSHRLRLASLRHVNN